MPRTPFTIGHHHQDPAPAMPHDDTPPEHFRSTAAEIDTPHVIGALEELGAWQRAEGARASLKPVTDVAASPSLYTVMRTLVCPINQPTQILTADPYRRRAVIHVLSNTPATGFYLVTSQDEFVAPAVYSGGVPTIGFWMEASTLNKLETFTAGELWAWPDTAVNGSYWLSVYIERGVTPLPANGVVAPQASGRSR
jgi:hypothetical protein